MTDCKCNDCDWNTDHNGLRCPMAREAIARQQLEVEVQSALREMIRALKKVYKTKKRVKQILGLD